MAQRKCTVLLKSEKTNWFLTEFRVASILATTVFKY